MNRLLVEGIVAVVVLSLIAGWWGYHDRSLEKRGEEKIKSAVAAERAAASKEWAARQASAEVQHGKEMGQIAQYNYSAGAASVVCRSTSPRSVRETPVFDSRKPPAGTVVADDGLHPDIAGALKVYAAGVAKLQADANRLREETR